MPTSPATGGPTRPPRRARPRAAPYRPRYGPRVTTPPRKSRSGTSFTNEERRARGMPVVKSFTVDQDVLARLEHEAARHQLSQTQIVNDALRAYLPTLERRKTP